MKTRQWHIEHPRKQVVRVEHGLWSGRAAVYLDSDVIFGRDFKRFDTGFEHRFTVDGVPCILRVIHRPFHYTYELWLDGRLQ